MPIFHITVFSNFHIKIPHFQIYENAVKSKTLLNTNVFLLFFLPAASLKLMLVLIFFSRCHASPDVALRLINVKNYSCPGCKSRIDMLQTICYILMFRRHELERFHPSPNRPAAGGKCPHSRPCPLQSSG